MIIQLCYRKSEVKDYINLNTRRTRGHSNKLKVKRGEKDGKKSSVSQTELLKQTVRNSLENTKYTRRDHLSLALREEHTQTNTHTCIFVCACVLACIYTHNTL